MKREKLVTVTTRVAELVEEHGSYRKAAKAIGMESSHLFRVGHAQQLAGSIILLKLGLYPATKFERISGH